MDLNLSASMAFPEVNVKIQVRNTKTGEVTHEIYRHNRVMKSAIFTLARVINGEFSEADNVTVNTNRRFQLYNFIPRYLALGTNVVGSGDSSGITSEVTVNDTRLLNELKYPRMKLTQRNLIENRFNAPYVKLIIKHYVPMTAYVGEKIGEAGLFTEETGNSLWARVTFTPFEKDEASVIDITWEITIVSMETSLSPYDSVDKSMLFNSINKALTKIAQVEPNYSTLKNLLIEGIKGYASLSDTQEMINDKTTQLELEINRIFG